MPVPVTAAYDALSNDEIRDRLKAAKYPSIGPVNDVTRKAYIMKLMQLEKELGIGDSSSVSPSAYRDSPVASSNNGAASNGDDSSVGSRPGRKSLGGPARQPATASKSPARRRTMAVVPTPATPVEDPRPVRVPPRSGDRNTPSRRSELAASDVLDSRPRIPAPPSYASSTERRPPSGPSVSSAGLSAVRPRFSAVELSDSEPEDRITGFRRRTLARPTVATSASSYEPNSRYYAAQSWKMPPFVLSATKHVKKNWEKILFAVLSISVVGVFIYATFKVPGHEDNYPVCPPPQLDGIDCIPSADLTAAIENSKKIKPILDERARLHDWPMCASDPAQAAIASVQRGLTSNEILGQYFGSISGTNFAKMRHVITLAHANPHWGVVLIDRSGARTDELPAAAGLESTKRFLPLGCCVSVLIETCFWRGLLLVATAGAVYGVYYMIRFYMNERERKERAVFALIERIIMVLSAHKSEHSESPYLPIHFVRDQLIKPSMRNDPETIALWNKAAAFIETAEPRVWVETRKVDGYDTKVWNYRGPGVTLKSPGKARLEATVNQMLAGGDESIQDEDVEMTEVGGPLTQRGNQEQQRMWQGSAFDNNKVKNSPTPCLKIRNMFDPEVETGDFWPHQIQDSLLEKCDGIPIVHIAVDKDSRGGTVYMKCLDEEAAGRAYNLLHGHWFDGNLVTVKYLHVDRYHTRFPQARHVLVPIRR